MFFCVTGTELQKRRLALKLSQEKLAQKLNVSLFTVARWEQLKDDELPNPGLVDLALRQLEADQEKK